MFAVIFLGKIKTWGGIIQPHVYIKLSGCFYDKVFLLWCKCLSFTAQMTRRSSGPRICKHYRFKLFPLLHKLSEPPIIPIILTLYIPIWSHDDFVLIQSMHIKWVIFHKTCWLGICLFIGSRPGNWLILQKLWLVD